MLIKHDKNLLKDVPAIVGIDEAGRGPLAGPVTAAAVYLDRGFYQSKWISEYGNKINDSKQLSEKVREELFEAMKGEPGICYSVMSGSLKEIEKYNILGATRRAMAKCVKQLLVKDSCDFNAVYEGSDWLLDNGAAGSVAQVLIDGKPMKPFPYTHTAIVKGDSKSLAIAMASIFAKVTRDRYMVKQAKKYPKYGFERHKGYGTKAHVAAIKEQGPCPIHRMSFLGNILS